MSSKEIVNCPSCFTCLPKKGCYEKHILRCDRDLTTTNIPTNQQLMEMITNLTEKYNGVQKELQSIKNQIYTKNKKIDVLKWLNGIDKTGQDNSISFIDVFDKMEISIEDLNLIFDVNFVNGVFEMIKKHLETHYEIDKLIKCFNQKKNILYIYQKDEWKIIENDDFISILKIINVKVFDTFKKYRDLHMDKADSEYFQTQYNANLKKIMCVNMPFESKCTKIRNKLYTEYKECIKSITEIELI
ncbi:hypothetical protein N8261_04745 [Flavobacteriaceae bacterium]|nr:hypothetical protein [Flavobacteriaceae bacterium]|tara:strand:- start:94 stop:825 length:732 start_codon:yes stop_codon:yes gene_type:complete